jgi:ubiquinone/menaquinone biosynthesis C-methylase UbiE/uncharacterized protein YbaR (Trm112 family)
MWGHALPSLRCPKCRGGLSLRAVEPEVRDPAGEPLVATTEQIWIRTGALLCTACSNVYPVHEGVPILLTYTSPTAKTATENWPDAVRRVVADAGFSLPDGRPPRGEKFVQASFSLEWEEYDYGDTLWTASTEDRIRTFVGECGVERGRLAGKRFCEIGCGLGIMTRAAANELGAEAWGVDLSQAVFRAAREFEDDPRLHFVQASVFAMPFAEESFDFVYSHGVLHHTWSTKAAIGSAIQHLRPDGSLYVWLYGLDDVRISLLRRVAYAGEALTRPLVARLPGPLATLALWPTVPLYQWASGRGIREGTHTKRYTARQALHAARDRFTPLFAHRHETGEVREWLERDFGFPRVETVRGDEVSESWRLAMDRNVALRAHRVAAAPGVAAR